MFDKFKSTIEKSIQYSEFNKDKISVIETWRQNSPLLDCMEVIVEPDDSYFNSIRDRNEYYALQEKHSNEWAEWIQAEFGSHWGKIADTVETLGY